MHIDKFGQGGRQTRHRPRPEPVADSFGSGALGLKKDEQHIGHRAQCVRRAGTNDQGFAADLATILPAQRHPRLREHKLHRGVGVKVIVTRRATVGGPAVVSMKLTLPRLDPKRQSRVSRHPPRVARPPRPSSQSASHPTSPRSFGSTSPSPHSQLKGDRCGRRPGEHLRATTRGQRATSCCIRRGVAARFRIPPIPLPAWPAKSSPSALRAPATHALGAPALNH